MRVLLLFPGALGDLVLLAPAAAALGRDARLELSVPRALAPIADGLLPAALGPALDGAVMASLFAGDLAPACAAWLRDADLAHVWLGREQGSACARVRAAGVARVCSHHVLRDDGPVHASVAYARDLAIAAPLSAPVLRLSDRVAVVSWRAAPARRLVVHPGAGAVAKRWRGDGFRAVADGWRDGGGEVTVLLGPAEEDLAPLWEAAGHPVARDLDLAAAAAVIASADHYVGNDSGISHLAGAVARSGVVVFGPTRPERWRPLGGRLRPVGFDADPGALVRMLRASVTARLP
jgi:hypothetical protein